MRMLDGCEIVALKSCSAGLAAGQFDEDGTIGDLRPARECCRDARRGGAAIEDGPDAIAAERHVDAADNRSPGRQLLGGDLA